MNSKLGSSSISVDAVLLLPLARVLVRTREKAPALEGFLKTATLLGRNLGPEGLQGREPSGQVELEVAERWLAMCAEGVTRSSVTESDERQRGVEQLVDCLDAPFRDVVADAAFALSVSLRLDPSRADECAACLTTALALRSVKALQANAAAALLEGEFPTAIASAKEILSEDPDPTQALAALNILFGAFESDPGSATTDYFQSLIVPWLDSTETSTRGSAALILARFADMPSGEFQRAEEHAMQALYGHESGRGDAWVTTAEVTWRLDGPAPALRMLSHIGSADEPHTRCAADVLRARIHQYSRAWQAASAACESALSTDWADRQPQSSLLDQASIILIDVLPRILATDEALLRLEALNCALPDFTARLADLQQMSGRSDLAMDLWTRAIHSGWRAFTGTFCAVVAEAGFPNDILKVIAASDDRRATRVLAESPACPIEILSDLALSGNEDTRSEVAANPNTPEAILCQLANDASTFVTLAVAANASASSDVLQSLSLRPEESVRRNIASNTSTPLLSLQMLVEAPEASIRAAIRDNPSSPDTLKALAAMTLLQ